MKSNEDLEEIPEFIDGIFGIRAFMLTVIYILVSLFINRKKK